MRLLFAGPLEWVGGDESDHMSVTVKAFTPAQLRCMVKGEGRITTKWFEDGVEMNTMPPFHRNVRKKTCRMLTDLNLSRWYFCAFQELCCRRG